jgi:Arc/MetJ-type ribon-helix-helix transcriptional regulator
MAKKNLKAAVRKTTQQGVRQAVQKMRTIRAEIPEEVYQQIDTLVKEGWFPSEEEIINDALRRFVYSHRPEIMEKHILEDVEWALRGGK